MDKEGTDAEEYCEPPDPRRWKILPDRPPSEDNEKYPELDAGYIKEYIQDFAPIPHVISYGYSAVGRSGLVGLICGRQLACPLGPAGARVRFYFAQL